LKEIEGWTARLLPSRQFGYIVLTTSDGIMEKECFLNCIFMNFWFLILPHMLLGSFYLLLDLIWGHEISGFIVWCSCCPAFFFSGKKKMKRNKREGEEER